MNFKRIHAKAKTYVESRSSYFDNRSDYERSKRFYTEILGLDIIRETFRKERQSFKLDLSLNGKYVIELFSFPVAATKALKAGGNRTKASCI